MKRGPRLGAGERVSVDDASPADHTRHLQLAEENERAVIKATQQTRERYYRLLPYYMAGAKTVAQAVAAYQKDQETQTVMSGGE